MNKKLILISVIVIISTSIYCQNHKIRMEIIYNYSIINRLTTGNVGNSLQKFNKPGMSSSFAIICYKSISEKSEIGIGSALNNFGSNSNFEGTVKMPDTGDYLEFDYKSKYRINYLNFPLLITKNINNDFHIRFGISNNFLISVMVFFSFK